MEYEEFSFWDTLAQKLAQWELLRQYSREELEQMDGIERIRLQAELEDKYWNEFEQHGLERILVPNLV